MFDKEAGMLLLNGSSALQTHLHDAMTSGGFPLKKTGWLKSRKTRSSWFKTTSATIWQWKFCRNENSDGIVRAAREAVGAAGYGGALEIPVEWAYGSAWWLYPKTNEVQSEKS